jgi:cation:H+ antiporter
VSAPVAVLVFFGGLALTILSSIVLARELDRLGERLGFSEALLGIVTGHEDTGVGVVVGSNVFNIAALLGLSAVIAGPVRIHAHGLVLNGGVAIVVALIGALLAINVIPAAAAFALGLLVVVPYVVLSALHARRRERLPAVLRAAVAEEQQDARRDEFAPPATGTDVLTILPALAAVVGGAYAMVAAAQSLGDRWDVSDVLIGTVVLAGLTGIPNVLAAVRLALHGRGAACVSESFNSNNANILVGLCVPALVLGLGDPSGIETFAAWAMVGMTALAVALGFGGGLTRREGGAIIALYAGFVAILALAG